ncbi:cytochrome b/b6 domain-containing protein [Acerihabitans arboris]|uniref:Cytochrome b/b6 domain-containing protein n=1 Tax=Acerihabitans arboris TaxID=2691583 RepID=A0A845SEQ9_9GAMM|nr:cytochrome b/b6 domain-containing protein [Acerihabitans arboris]NDL63463.1 cytochrome b/b6 domain-containing protein [Acerihabitans arboris]
MKTSSASLSKIRLHRAPVRIMHWLNVPILCAMLMSGWGIYNASPIFPALTFPTALTLGGWLGGSIAWHLAVMWALAANGLLYILWGLFSGHFRRDFLPLTPRSALRDVKLALTFRLEHRLGRYNAIQKAFYWFALLCGLLLVLSGLSIWKPVQLYPLVALFGGFDRARYVHFFAMGGIVMFAVVHVAMVVTVPSTFLPMITGYIRRKPRETSDE